jgi:uncharacterized protein YdeI (YjbR/CyaY-like superfamily)
MGGSYWLGVSAENRAGAAVAGGETHEVTITLDDAPRVMEVPDDLAAAIAANPGASARWQKLSFSHQRAQVEAVTGTRNPETRARRIEKAVATLEAEASA